MFQLDPCVWNKCINPPIPNGNNLKHSWHGQPLDFYDNVTYTCAFEGYWFEDDRDLVAFDVPCLPGGRFGVPSPWPLCLQSIIQCNILVIHVEFTCPRILFSG